MKNVVVGLALRDFNVTPMPELETGIITLGSDIAAAEAVWLLMIAAFDAREGWAGHGVASCAHWLSWRCGLSAATAREKVRVARALVKLPKTAEAFEKGELSYSRARAITRVATPETEEELVDLARHTTGAQLERVVRAMSGVLRADDVKERSYRRHVSWHWDDDGSLVLSARLDPVEGAAVINAIEAAQAVERNADKSSSSDRDGSSDRDSVADADGASGDNRLTLVAGDTGETCTPDEVAQPKSSAESATVAQTPSAPERTPSAGPPETMECPRGDAADAARESRIDAFVSLAESFIASTGQSTGADVYQVVVHLREDGSAHLDGGPAVPSETARRLSCDATFYCVHEDADGNVMDVGRRTRAVTPSLHRALRHRDGSCRFPGCGRRRRLHGHHVKHWAHGGRTMLVNLVYVCPRHHVLVHEGGFGVTMQVGQPVFSSPDGSVIQEGPAGPASTGVPAQWHRADVRPTAVDTQWAGEPLDLSYVVAGLVRDRSGEGFGQPARVSRHHDGSEGTRCDSGVVPPL